MLDFRRIEKLASQFPGLEVSTSYGTPALKVGKKLVLRMHQKEDAIVLMVASVDEQQRLIEEDPMSFFITDHYAGYPAVLVRPTVPEQTFAQLLEGTWRRLASKRQVDAYDGS